MQVLTVQENNQEVLVSTEERFALSLSWIPSTGFTWTITDLPAGLTTVADSAKDDDSQLLELGVTEEVLQIDEKANENPELCGGSYHRVFVFETKENFSGGELKLSYHQSWESEPSLETFAVQLSAS